MSTLVATPTVINADVAEEERVEYPPCTVQEDLFALAVVEAGGNIRAAYKMAFGDGEAFPMARANDLIRRPQVAMRIQELTASIDQTHGVTLASHLNELAEIRDLAKMTGQLKTALSAEISRGNAVGIYKQAEKPVTVQAPIQINFVNRYDHTV